MVGPRFLSIRAKLAGSLIAFLFLALGTLGIFLNVTITRTLQTQALVQEKRYAENIQQSINQVLFAGKYQVQAYVESLVARDPSLRYVAVIDRETMRAIAHSDPSQVGKIFDDPLTLRGFDALKQPEPVAQASKLADGEPIHDLSLPFLRGYLREPAGIIRIGTSTATLWQAVDQARAISLVILLIALAAGAFMAFALTVRLTAGLHQFVATVTRFGEGDYQAMIPERPGVHDEIDLLGTSFNRMASQLKEVAGGLERQVEERTRELAQANEKISQSEELLRTVVMNAPVILFALDPEGQFVLSEGRGLNAFDLIPGELVGWRFEEAFANPEARAMVTRALAGERVHQVLHTPGNLSVEHWLNPVIDAQGQVIRIIGVAIDISERMRLEAQLRSQYERLKELDHLKSNFVNAVTHELRTPLTSIMGYAEFLEDGIGGALAESQLEFVHQIQRGSRRLEFLLNDLLDFARIEAGTFHLRLADADLGRKMRDIADSLRPQAEDGGIELSVRLPETPLLVRMDAQRIGQVLINLIGNALKFTPPGGRIVVSARHEGDPAKGEPRVLRCEVADTGIGIAAADIPKLFQRFSQLESGVKQGKGAGLGLSISKALIEAHGGQIGVESALNRGSTFWFTLPLDAEPEDASQEAEA
jgi:signal transduction histidine kinase